MKDEFQVQSLGVCEFDSPVEGAYTRNDEDGILVDPTLSGCRVCDGFPVVMEAAGPRNKIFVDPTKTRAAIVTCGGLCPGLNDVLRGITMILWFRYGVKEIF